MKKTKKTVGILLILAMVCSLAGIFSGSPKASVAMQNEYRLLEGEERFLPMTPIASDRGVYKSVKTNSPYLKAKLVKDATNPGLQVQALFCYSGYTQTTTAATVYWYDKKDKVTKHFNITVHIVQTPPLIFYDGSTYSFAKGTANFDFTMDEGETKQLVIMDVPEGSIDPESGWYTKTTNTDVINGRAEFDGTRPMLILTAGTASRGDSAGGAQASTLTATLKFDQGGFTHIYTIKVRVRVNDKSGGEVEEETILAPKIDTPFRPYYEGCDEVSIEKADLRDDFGIGLSTDSSEESVKKVSAVRVIAKIIRNYIMATRSISDKNDANAEMKNYIRFKSGAITGLSTDGIRWNTGAFSDLNLEAGASDGYWQLFVDSRRVATNLDKTYIELNSDPGSIRLLWVPTQGVKGESGYWEAGIGMIQDFYGGYEVAGQDLLFRVLKEPYTEKSKEKYDLHSAATGAAVEIYNAAGRKMETISEVSELGEFTLKKSYKPGIYTFRAYQPVTLPDGRVTSGIIYTSGYITLVKKIKIPKTVGITMDTGKKAILSWKGKKSTNDYYIVEGAKKKDGNYKVINANVTGTSLTFKAKPKNRYVRIKHVQYYTGGEFGRWLESDYCEPVVCYLEQPDSTTLQ